MPYARPTLTALENQAIQDITTSGVPGLFGLLRNAVLRVLAWVMAAFTYSVYGYVDWIAKQAVPFTSTDEFLFAWAGLIGVYPKDATAASGSATFLGLAGTPLPSGTALTRQDGVACVTTADGVVSSGGAVTVPLVSTDLGAATDGPVGMGINIASPIPGINAGGTLAGPMTGGADQETQDELRSRMLAKYRAPPQGGAAADYQQWALEVPGCTRAWVTANGFGPGSVTVFPMFDDAEAAHGGFPQGKNGTASEETRGTAIATGDQLAVAEHIWPVQPVTALVYVVSPVAAPLNVALVGLSPNTPDMLAAISASLADMLLVTASPGGTIWPSDVYEAIIATPGINHFAVSAPTGPFTPAAGALPVLGTLTAS